MSWTVKSVGSFLSKNLSRWSTEFSMLITVTITLLSIGLIDIWVVKTMLTIALFLFFAGMSHKFILAMIKQQTDFMRELNKEKEPEKKEEN